MLTSTHSASAAWITLLLLLLASHAGAAQLASDSFSYPDGPLAGQSGGSGWAYNWTGSGTNVSGGQAVGVNPSTIGFTQRRGFATLGTTSTLFVSLDFISPASVPLGDSFAVILAAGVNGSNLVIGKGPGDSVFAVGNSSFHFQSAIPVVANTTYHLIGAYDLTNQRVSLWIDPDGSDYYDASSGANSADVSGLNAVGGNMERVVFGGTIQFARVDNLVIGETPGDVGLQSAPQAVPALEGPSLVVLSLLLVAAGLASPSLANARLSDRLQRESFSPCAARSNAR